MTKMKKVPLEEVQGIILRGYEWLQEGTFLLLRFSPNQDRSRAWLKDLVPNLRHAKDKPDNNPSSSAINLAFTFPGLSMLGFHEYGLDKESNKGAFSEEFREGMDTKHRRRLLGDLNENNPETWRFGNEKQRLNEHAMLLIYANTIARRDELVKHWQEKCAEAGIQVIHSFEISKTPLHKEHFGFKDGIAQPAIKNVEKSEPERLQQTPSVSVESKTTSNTIETGEILLGFHNEYSRFPPSPIVTIDGELRDFGCYGSYMVFRQLEQDVCAFWRYIDEQARASSNSTGSALVEVREKWAAKMVGRWTSGAPLALSPDRDNTDLADQDVFRFNEDDPIGLKTPIGSHIRRSNPRDSLEPGLDGKERLTAEDSLRVTRLHRLIRRGRPYGPPVASTMKHTDILESAEGKTGRGAERGLLFLCFNASIARQFELVQQTWINNPKFGGLYRENDPLMGTRKPDELSETADVFTVPQTPVRLRLLNLPSFVTVKGGGYFFMPGIEAIKFLAGLPAKLPKPPAKEETATIAPGQI